MKTKLFLIMGLLNTGLIFSQVKFEKTYSFTGNDVGNHIIQTSDGGYMIGGSAGYTGLALIKTDANGDTLWTKVLEKIEICNSIKQTTDGGYIIASNDVLIKTDVNGNITWGKKYTSFRIIDAMQTEDNGYLYTGSDDGMNMTVAKTNASGDIDWTKVYSDPASVKAYMGSSIERSSDGNYMICGFSWYYPDPANPIYPVEDILVLKINTNGDLLWTRSYANQGDNFPRLLGFPQVPSKQGDGSFLIVSSVQIPSSGFPGLNGRLTKIDKDGNIIWESQFGGSHGIGYDAAITSTGYVVTGRASNSTGETSIPVIKCDINTGNLIWTRFFGPSRILEGQSIIGTSDGGVALTGRDDMGKVYFVKTDDEGYTDCTNNDTTSYFMTSLGYGANPVKVASATSITSAVNIPTASGANVSTVCSVSPFFSAALSIHESDPMRNSILVYPSIGNGQFQVLLNSRDIVKKASAEIAVYDLLGKAIGTWPLEQDRNDIDISKQHKGIYFYQIKTKAFGSGTSASEEIIDSGKLIVQ